MTSGAYTISSRLGGRLAEQSMQPLLYDLQLRVAPRTGKAPDDERKVCDAERGDERAAGSAHDSGDGCADGHRSPDV